VILDTMSPIAIATIVFVCVFAGALLGMFLRTVLPEHHLSDASKDVIKLVVGLIATLAALVLGLLVASAKSSFDTANNGFRESGARLIMLDRALAQYGPETKDLREVLRNTFAGRIDRLFAKEGSERDRLGSDQGTLAIEAFQQTLRALSPQNDAQREHRSRALELSQEVAQARWMQIEQEENTIPAAFLVVLVFWLAVMFASFGLFAPRNAVAIVVLCLGALSLAAAIFLIEELYDPIGGIITISSAPMYNAIGLLGH
jgi:ABC-type multidrug transport system fused ATPase/permease subunit